ncbi:MAG: hypothetical protein KUL88_14975 [Rhizobium sp.]|nr:hypothetical protein [Rhizobium sp.]
MFINAEVALPIPRGPILAGRLLRAILALPVNRVEAPCPASADAMALVPGLAIDDWHRAAERVIRHQQVRRGVPVLVVVDSGLDADQLDTRLSIIVPARPDGLVLCGVKNGADLQRIDVMLSVAEASAGHEPGETAILAVIGDNPAGLLDAASLAGRTQRLQVIGRNPAALAAAIGIAEQSPVRSGDGAIALSRGLTLLAATNAGVAALDWLDPALNGEALSEACRRARADGFGVLVAEDPAQLAAIAEAYR